jgi:3-oxoacyl-[acyl-carrier protein] reductase
LRQVDITDSQSVKDFLLAAETQWGRLDSIVVATGPRIPICPILDISLETFRHVIETEVYGAFNIVKSGCEILRRQPGSNKSILFVLSCSLRRTLDFDGMSYIPKMAVEGLIRQTVREGGKDGIRLNGIGLGGFATGPGPAIPGIEDEFMGSVLANVQTPSGRLGTGDEIASLGAFLISDGATYINGQIVGADGGYSA